MMNMYSNKCSLPDSDDENQEDITKNENKNLEVKNEYVKLDDIQEVDNKLEIDKEEVKKEEEENAEIKDINKDIEKDKTQDISNRSIDPLVKGQEENKLENTPTSNTQKKPKKIKKENPKGNKFDTVYILFNFSLI